MVNVLQRASSLVIRGAGCLYGGRVWLEGEMAR